MDFIQLVSGHSRVYAWVSVSQVVLLLGFGVFPALRVQSPGDLCRKSLCHRSRKHLAHSGAQRRSGPAHF